MDHEYSCTKAPVLYYDAINSHARSCQMLIKLLKIDVELRSTDSISDINFYDTYTWINSFCMLPTLVDGNVTLCNGHSILIYLCEKYAPLNLANVCPCDYISRLRLMSLLFYEGCILFRRLQHLLTDIFLAKHPNFDVDSHKHKVSNVFKTLNTFLKGQSFMIGNHLTIADISCVSTVSALNIIFPIDYEKFPKLFDWLQRIKKMEFYNYNEEGIQKLRYLLKKVGKFPFPSPFSNEPPNEEGDSEKSDGQTIRKANESDTIIEANEVMFRHVDAKPKTFESSNVKQIYNADAEASSDSFENIFEFPNIREHDPEKMNVYNTDTKNSCNCNTNNFSMKKQDLKKNNEIYRRTECNNCNNISIEHENGILSPTTNYTICGCCYSHNNVYGVNECKTPPTIDMKSCIHVQYYGANIDHQNCRPSSSRRKEGYNRNKLMACSCFYNNESKNIPKSDRRSSKNKCMVKETDIENSENNKRDIEEWDDTDFEEDIEQQSVKCEETCSINKPFTNKFNPNKESEFITQNANKFEISRSSTPFKKYNSKNGTNGFTNQEVKNLLAKVRSLEKILENTTSEMINKNIQTNLPRLNKNSVIDTKVSEDSSFKSSEEENLPHNSVILNKRNTNYGKIDMSRNNEDPGFTYQDIENLLEKFRNFEYILETPKSGLNGKEMVSKSTQMHLTKSKNKSNRNSISDTNVSDDFSVESLTEEEENFANDYAVPEPELSDKVQINKSNQWNLQRFSNNSDKSTVLVTDTSKDSSVEPNKIVALEFEKSELEEDDSYNSSLNDKICETGFIPRLILVPNFIVTNSEREPQNPITSNNSSPQSPIKETTTEYPETHSSGRYCSKHKRLEAGSNPKPQENLSYEDDLPMTSAQFKQRNVGMEDNVSFDSEKLTKVIYHLCMKNTSKYRNKCPCDDCLKKEKKS